jgi:hypothetical protein
MFLNKPELKISDDQLTYTVNVTLPGLPEKLWYKVSSRYKDFVSDSLDAAVTALLIPAMQAGEDIIVKGKISDSLLYNLNNDVQSILSILHPQLKIIKIKADNVESSSPRSEHVATGFSGGVDSFCTLARNFYPDDVSPGYRITHLLYNNVGSHGQAGEALWAKRYHHLKRLPEKYGIPFIAVNSNLEEFYRDYSFISTHTPRDASVGLLLQNGIGRYLYSSSVNYNHISLAAGKAITFMDPVLLPQLSTSSIQMLSVGSGSRRVDKVLEIADIPDAWEFLDVCIDEENEKNCSKCIKCLKTQFALEVGGKLEKFNNVFNNEIYQENRIRFISSGYRDKTFHISEILNLAKQKKYPVPYRTKIYSMFRIYGFLRIASSILPRLQAINEMSQLILQPAGQSKEQHKLKKPNEYS